MHPSYIKITKYLSYGHKNTLGLFI